MAEARALEIDLPGPLAGDEEGGAAAAASVSPLGPVDSPAPCPTPSPSSSPPPLASSVAVGHFLRAFAALPVDQQFATDHRFFRQEVFRLAKQLQEQVEVRKAEAQKRRFRERMEQQRCEARDFLPPSAGTAGLVVAVPARPRVPALASSDGGGGGEDAVAQASPLSADPSASPSPSPSPSASPGGLDSDSSSAALSVYGADGSTPLTLEQLAALRPHRRKPRAQKQDPTRAVKPHLTKLGGSTKGQNRQQLQDASRTVRQLRHMGAVRCYVCKATLEDDRLRHTRFTNHCILCGSLNDAKRNLVVPMPGRIAVVTGARIKIGFQVGLKLLRCGVTLIATTRFPSNLLLRYAQEEDYARWRQNLHVLYADLMNPQEVQDLARRIQAMVPHVDMLIHNAAQTIRRPRAYYERLNAVEQASKQRLLALMEPEEQREVARQIQAAEKEEEQAKGEESAQPTVQAEAVAAAESASATAAGVSSSASSSSASAASVAAAAASSSSTALSSSSSSLPSVGLVSGCTSAPSLARATRVLGTGLVELPRRAFQPFSHIPTADELTREQEQALFPEGKVDTTNDHEPLDLRAGNSWNAQAHEVDPRELAEVLSTNAMAPFILTTALKPWMMKSPHEAKYVIFVSSMEGKLNRTKEDMHAHTNMGKAALNALTRTISTEFATKGIYVNSVDTGWNSEERAVNDPKRDATFETPLDCTDGAARILDPIFEGEQKQRYIFGQFLKDYAPSDW